MRAVYTILFFIATPFVLARLYWRGRRNPAYKQRIGERLGWYTSHRNRVPSIWVHAVSVGEAESAVPLIRALQQRHADHPLLVTTTTPTGSDRVRALFGDRVQHCYLPYDLPWCVERFLLHHRPQLALIMETEIWPNLYDGCARHSIPLLIVNGRLSARSTRGYQRLGRLVRDTLSRVTAIAAQTQDDADRFVSIGAAPEKVAAVGNVKFDLELPENLSEQRLEDRQRLFGDRPILIAASTHDGEESLLMAAYGRLQNRYPNLLLVLVPRHPERFGVVADLCRSAGFALVSRSQGRACAPSDQIFLLDVMGELKRFYASADIAFVGGSLVPVGGHNVLEPAAAGIPVLFGPHVQNFREICAGLTAAGGALACDDIEDFAGYADQLLADADRRALMGSCGQGFVKANRGAVDRVVALVDHHLAAAVDASVATTTSPSASNGAGRPMK